MTKNRKKNKKMNRHNSSQNQSGHVQTRSQARSLSNEGASSQAPGHEPSDQGPHRSSAWSTPYPVRQQGTSNYDMSSQASGHGSSDQGSYGSSAWSTPYPFCQQGTSNYERYSQDHLSHRNSQQYPVSVSRNSFDVQLDSDQNVEHYPQGSHRGQNVRYMVGHFESGPANTTLRLPSQSLRSSSQAKPKSFLPDQQPALPNKPLLSNYIGHTAAVAAPPKYQIPAMPPPFGTSSIYDVSGEQKSLDREVIWLKKLVERENFGADKYSTNVDQISESIRAEVDAAETTPFCLAETDPLALPPGMSSFYPMSKRQEALDHAFAEELQREEYKKELQKCKEKKEDFKADKNATNFDKIPKVTNRRDILMSSIERGNQVPAETHNGNTYSNKSKAAKTVFFKTPSNESTSRSVPPNRVDVEVHNSTTSHVTNFAHIGLDPRQDKAEGNSQKSICDAGKVASENEAINVAPSSEKQSLRSRNEQDEKIYIQDPVETPNPKTEKRGSFFGNVTAALTSIFTSPNKTIIKPNKTSVTVESQSTGDGVYTSAKDVKQYPLTEFEKKYLPIEDHVEKRKQNKNAFAEIQEQLKEDVKKDKIRQQISNIEKKIEQKLEKETGNKHAMKPTSAQGAGLSIHQQFEEEGQKTGKSQVATDKTKDQVPAGNKNTAEDAGSNKQLHSEKKQHAQVTKTKSNADQELRENKSANTQQNNGKNAAKVNASDKQKNKNTEETNGTKLDSVILVEPAKIGVASSVPDPPIQQQSKHEENAVDTQHEDLEWRRILGGVQLSSGYYASANEMKMQFCFEFEHLTATVSGVTLTVKKFWGPMSQIEELQLEVTDLLRQLQTLFDLDPPQKFKQQIEAAMESLRASRELLKNRTPMIEAQSQAAAAAPKSAEKTKANPPPLPSRALKEVTLIAMQAMRLYRQVCSGAVMTRGQHKVLGDQLTQCQLLLDDIKDVDPEAREASKDVHNLCNQAQERLSQPAHASVM